MANPAQRRKLGRGMVMSVAGVMVCWATGAGSAAVAGRVVRRVIVVCAGQPRALCDIHGAEHYWCALVSVGALMAMLYVYFGNPELLAQVTDWLMTKLNIQ